MKGNETSGEKKYNIICVCEEIGVCVQEARAYALRTRYILGRSLVFFLRGGRWRRLCCSLLFAKVIGQSNVCINCVVHSIWEACSRPHCPAIT